MKILRRVSFAAGVAGLVAWAPPLSGSTENDHPILLIGLVFAVALAVTFEGEAWTWR